jgi:metal-responsive CopG/Arc/MetJ family transcriptional regulator
MTHKIAISMPEGVFQRLERVRLAQKLSRSAVIQRAVDSWLREQEQSAAAARYVEGYLRVPEDVREGDAWFTAEAWGPYEEG